MDAEEREVGTAVASRGQLLAHLHRVVLVVARAQHGDGTVEAMRVGVQIGVAQVLGLVAGALDERDQRQQVDHELAVALGAFVATVGTIEGDGTRAGREGAVRPEVKAVAAEDVVGLPGGVGVQQHDLAVGVTGLHGEHDVALAAGVGVEPDAVEAGNPAGRVERERDRPVGDDRVGRAQ